MGLSNVTLNALFALLSAPCKGQIPGANPEGVTECSPGCNPGNYRIGRQDVLAPRSRQARSTMCDEGCLEFYSVQMCSRFVLPVLPSALSFRSLLTPLVAHGAPRLPATGCQYIFHIIPLMFPGLHPGLHSVTPSGFIANVQFPSRLPFAEQSASHKPSAHCRTDWHPL